MVEKMLPNRVLLKLSGEVLRGIYDEGRTSPDTPKPWIYNRAATDFIAGEIKSAHPAYEIAGILGGGNILRGTQVKNELNIDGVIADDMGMLATVMNALAFKDVLERHYQTEARVMTALEMRDIAEKYIRGRAKRHLGKGRVVLLACGIGKPDFTTDTAMIQYAHELKAGIILKGTKVDGIYESDPVKNPGAKKLPRVSYGEYLTRGLKIVDDTAVTQAAKHGFTIRIFNIFKKGNLQRILAGEDIGSVISSEGGA